MSGADYNQPVDICGVSLLGIIWVPSCQWNLTLYQRLFDFCPRFLYLLIIWCIVQMYWWTHRIRRVLFGSLLPLHLPPDSSRTDWWEWRPSLLHGMLRVCMLLYYDVRVSNISSWHICASISIYVYIPVLILHLDTYILWYTTQRCRGEEEEHRATRLCLAWIVLILYTMHLPGMSCYQWVCRLCKGWSVGRSSFSCSDGRS